MKKTKLLKAEEVYHMASEVYKDETVRESMMTTIRQNMTARQTQ